MFSPDVDPKRRLSTRIGKDRYEEICRVYFIEAVGLELVKIGYARDVTKRFRGMLTMSPVPLSLLADTPGGPRLETELHDRFDTLRAHGEWFRKTPEVQAVIDAAEFQYAERTLIPHQISSRP